MADRAPAATSERGASSPSAGGGLGITVPDTRLHPIYLVIETAKTLRQAIPFLVVTILGGAPWWVNTILFGIVMVVGTAAGGEGEDGADGDGERKAAQWTGVMHGLTLQWIVKQKK